MSSRRRLSLVAHFELYDGVRVLVIVIIGDEESISKPEIIRNLELNAREFSPAGRRAVDARAPTGPDSDVIATSVALPDVAENQQYASGTWMRWSRAMRGAALHTEQLHIRVRSVILTDEHSRVIQRATYYDQTHFDSAGLHALRLAPLAAVAAQCHQPVVPLSVRPFFARTHEQCVRVTHEAHTLKAWVCVVWGSVHVTQVAGIVAHSHRAHRFVVVIREEQLVARRVVAHS